METVKQGGVLPYIILRVLEKPHASFHQGRELPLSGVRVFQSIISEPPAGRHALSYISLRAQCCYTHPCARHDTPRSGPFGARSNSERQELLQNIFQDAPGGSSADCPVVVLPSCEAARAVDQAELLELCVRCSEAGGFRKSRVPYLQVR